MTKWMITVNSEYQRHYYQANKARIAENRRHYYQANKARIAKNRRHYYQANKARIAEYQRQYRQAKKQKSQETIQAIIDKTPKRGFCWEEYEDAIE